MAESPISIFQGWKIFCCRYFQYWCKNNAPYALIIQPTSGAVGLIRKHSVSLFRSLENTELLADGMMEILALCEICFELGLYTVWTYFNCLNTYSLAFVFC